MHPSSQTTGGPLTYQHALRLIELTYMPDTTTLTKEDEQLLKTYIHIHDFEYNLHNKSKDLFLALCKIEPRIEELKKRLDKLKKALNETVKMADKLSQNSYIPEETNLEMILENNDATAVEIADYHEQINDLYKEVKHHHNILNACMKSRLDDGDEAYDAYGKISHKHNEHYLNNNIDIVSIDIDFNKFCSVRDIYEEQRDDYIERSEKIMVDYNELNLQTTGFYRVWEEFAKRCELIKVVSELHQSSIGGSVN